MTMNLFVYKTYEELSRHAADQVIQSVVDKPEAVLCMATGSTPILTYSYVSAFAKQNRVDFSRVHFISLDEWVGVPRTNAGSCYAFLHASLFAPLVIRNDHIHFFNTEADDLVFECKRIDAKIIELGGIDFMLLGVGMNGHIGFNEPGVSRKLNAHVIELDEVTCTVGQKYFSEETKLKNGITLGLAQIMKSRKILLLATGSDKQDIIRKTLEGKISNDVPASFIRKHPNGYVLLDLSAAGELTIGL